MSVHASSAIGNIAPHVDDMVCCMLDIGFDKIRIEPGFDPRVELRRFCVARQGALRMAQPIVKRAVPATGMS